MTMTRVTDKIQILLVVTLKTMLLGTGKPKAIPAPYLRSPYLRVSVFLPVNMR